MVRNGPGSPGPGTEHDPGPEDGPGSPSPGTEPSPGPVERVKIRPSPLERRCAYPPKYLDSLDS